MGAAPFGFPGQCHFECYWLGAFPAPAEISTGWRERAIHEADKSLGLFVPLFPHVKNNAWILGHIFQSSYWAYAQLTNHCTMLLHVVLCVFFMYSFSISLTHFVKTAFRARPETFQSSVLWLNCTQDFYKKQTNKQKRHKEKKKMKDILSECLSFGSDSNLYMMKHPSILPPNTKKNLPVEDICLWFILSCLYMWCIRYKTVSAQ